MYDPSKHKGIEHVVSLVDTSLKGVIGSANIFSVLFFTFLPMIALMAGVKWLFLNGYIN